MTPVETPSNPGSQVGRGRVLALISTLAATYVISQFLRNSIGVIVPDLSRDLSLNAAEIGLLSSLFFLVFGLAQLPLGIAIDRFGPRAAILGSISLAVAGAALFGLAGSFGTVITARVLMGLGCAALLMAPMAIYRRWFSHERFSSLLGLQIGIGSLGALLATAPFARAAEWVGWRPVFLTVAAATAVMAGLVAAVARDDPPGVTSPKSGESFRQAIGGVVAAMRTPDAGRLFAMHFCASSIYPTMLGLWGGPYLAHVYGMTLAQRGDVLLLLAVAQIAGLFLWGPSDRVFGSYRTPVLLGAGTTILLMAGVTVVDPLPQPWLALWFVLLGGCSAYLPVMMAHGVSLYPPNLVGRGMTLMNLGTMSGAFIWQSLTGLIVAAFPATGGVYPPAAYRTIFVVQAVALLVASIIYLRARDPRRDQQRQMDSN